MKKFIFLLIVLIFLISGRVGAKIYTNIIISVDETVVQQDAPGFGCNIGTPELYADYTPVNNYVNNPGLEIASYHRRAFSASSNYYTGEQTGSNIFRFYWRTNWWQWPEDYWTGASYYFVYSPHSTNIGKSGYIEKFDYTNYYFKLNGVSDLTNTDYIIFTKTNFTATNEILFDTKYTNQDGKLFIPRINGWAFISYDWNDKWTNNSVIVKADRLDKHSGENSVMFEITNGNIAGGYRGIEYIVNNSNSFYLYSEKKYLVSFWAKSDGIQKVRVKIHNVLGPTVNITNDITMYTDNVWHKYNWEFYGQYGYSISLMLTINNDKDEKGSIWFDDISFMDIVDSASNYVCKNLVDIVKEANFEVLRNWGGSFGKGNLESGIHSMFERPMHTGGESYEQWEYGLPEFLELCKLTGANPWIVIPWSFLPQDASDLMEYLGGERGTYWGNKRILDGQSTPWLQIFDKVYLEFGNETWNPTFRPWNYASEQQYGVESTYIFNAIKNSPYYDGNKVKTIVNGQKVWVDRNREISENTLNADYLDIDGYLGPSVDYSAGKDKYYYLNSMLLSPHFINEWYVISNQAAVNGTGNGAEVKVCYEFNGSCNDIIRVGDTNIKISDGYVNNVDEKTYAYYMSISIASHVAAFDNLLNYFENGFKAANVFSIGGANVGTSYEDHFWTVVEGVGSIRKRKPLYELVKMYDLYIPGSDMITVSYSNMPVTNHPAHPKYYKYMSQTNNIPLVKCYAFRKNKQYSYVFINRSLYYTNEITLKMPYQPSSYAELSYLTSDDPLDNIVIKGEILAEKDIINNFHNNYKIKLRPFSAYLLNTYKEGETQNIALSIFNVEPVQISDDKVTIIWESTVDSDSRVQYGLLNRIYTDEISDDSFTTGHKIQITGLNNNTVYYFKVWSKDSLGRYAVSSNFSFTTSLSKDITSPVVTNIIISTNIIADAGGVITFSADSEKGVNKNECFLLDSDRNRVVSKGVAVDYDIDIYGHITGTITVSKLFYYYPLLKRFKIAICVKDGENNLSEINYSSDISVNITEDRLVCYNNVIKPGNSKAYIKCDVIETGYTVIEIYTTSGKKIKSVYSGNINFGRHIFEWSGDDDADNSVGTGVYLVRMKKGDKIEFRKIVVVR